MYGCIVDVIIPTSLVYVLFDPAIPTSSFNFIQLFLYLYNIILDPSCNKYCDLIGQEHTINL